MTEMSPERPLPEALVPDIWRCEPAPCPHCGEPWHAEPRGACETSCLAPVVIVPKPMPLLWWNDTTEPDCG